MISRAECFTLIAVYWRVTGVDYVNMTVKLQYTYISISYTIICVIYYDSTDIVKLFSSHYKLTICTYTSTYCLCIYRNDITHNFNVTYICILGWWPCNTNNKIVIVIVFLITSYLFYIRTRQITRQILSLVWKFLSCTNLEQYTKR